MNPGPEERVIVLTGVKVVFEEAAVRSAQPPSDFSREFECTQSSTLTSSLGNANA